MHIMEPNMIKRMQYWASESMVSICNMVESAIFAQSLGTSEAELQFDSKILRTRILPAVFNPRSTTLHDAWHMRGSSPGKVESMKTEKSCKF